MKVPALRVHKQRVLIHNGSADRARAVVEIVHPEHKPLALPQGMHLVIVQREYDEARPQQVLD
jgi:hypothetical protein